MTTLLLVHAHPDDECIATGGVILRAHHDRIRVVLVTATRGEEGDIHNMDADAVRPRLGEVRTEELMRSCSILGVDRQEFLVPRRTARRSG
jgi:LmbE family N-acetylglucosaminyl deacetylase